MQKSLAIQFGIIALMLAGCTPQETNLPSASSTPTPTPTPVQATELGEVTSIDEVVEAYVKAGGACNWESSEPSRDEILEQGYCSDSVSVKVFATDRERNSWVCITQMDDPVSMLVGPNWLITAKDAPAMFSTIGGVPVISDADSTYCDNQF